MKTDAADAIDVESRTSIQGSVNDQAYEGTVVAHFNTARGGGSSCSFTRLPESFGPGTIGTHT